MSRVFSNEREKNLSFSYMYNVHYPTHFFVHVVDKIYLFGKKIRKK